MHCINATTGEEVWTIDGYGTQGGMAIADGYMIYLNLYDMQIYCVGKGPSALTVDAPGVAIVEGESMMITGTVTDQSPGAVGTPAVSDAVMGDWMEYLYMQKPMPMDATGVEVVLEVFDPNGNFYEIGTTTSDTEGNYGLMWTPDVPGEYMVLASFLGSESYWGSHDSTYVGVVDAPEPTPEPEATPASMTDTYVLGMGAAGLAAIIVIGLVLIMMMRKK